MLRNFHRILLFPLALLLAGAADDPLPLTEMPTDVIPYSSAPSLKALITLTHPTLTYPLRHGTLFIWCNTDNPTPFFTIATAHTLPKNQAGQSPVAVFQVDKDDSDNRLSRTSFDNSNILPRTTIHLTKEPAPNSSTFWAAKSASHPKQGTLYQLGFQFEPAGPISCWQQEYRALLLHRASQWQLLDVIIGSGHTECDSSIVDNLTINWSPNPAAIVPLGYTLTTRDTNYGDHTNPRIIPTYTEAHFTGPLGNMKISSTSTYLRIKPGDTFSQLTAAFARQHATGNNQPEYLRLLRRSILSASPSLNPNHLHPGDRLPLLDLDLLRAASRKIALPPSSLPPKNKRPGTEHTPPGLSHKLNLLVPSCLGG